MYLDFILARLREPSTYAGLATILAANGFQVSTGVFDAGVTVAVSIAGLAAVLLSETNKTPKE